MSNLKAVILAGGKGTRMNSELPKVLHKVYDRCIIDYVCNACEDANFSDICIIVGHKADQVIKHAKKENITFCMQEEQLGTGHAVMQAKDHIEDEDTVLVINGDQPLISSYTIKSLISYFEQGNYGGAVLSGIVETPGSLGRVVRDGNGNLVKIVEKKDCNEQQLKIREINIGVYCFKGKLLKDSLSKLDNNNAQKEYYITDIPSFIMKNGDHFGVFVIPDISEFQGINSREELSIVTKTLLDKTRKKHMENGVTLISPDNTYISLDVEIGKDTVIYPGTNLQGETIIGTNCVIGPTSHIISSTIGNNVELETSKVVNSSIGDNCHIGPFVHLNNNSYIDDNSDVESFTEISNI